MKAIVVTRYGPPEVLQLIEMEKPVPKGNDVLVRIHAAAINATDPVFRKGEPAISRIFTGFTRPRNPIPGDVLAGEIEEIGKDVTLFKRGDPVFGVTTVSMGAHAGYKCLPEDAALAIKPDNLSFEEAAGLCDGALTALPFLRDKGKIHAGQKILVYGASGSVGTAAVQLANYFGAKVTGVCSTGNLEMVKSLGAHTVIDYTKDDFAQSGETYDIVFDTVGKTSFSHCRKALKGDGIYLTTVPSLKVMLRSLFFRKKNAKKAIFAATGLRPAKEKAKDLSFLANLAREGRLTTVIDRQYAMEDIQEAHRYVEKGHKKGNVILAIQ